LWAIAAIYIPIMGAGLTTFQTWAVSIIILALLFLSLVLHSFAHILAARATGSPAKKQIFLSPLGDPAQYQPAAASAGKEALAAFAGPFIQGILAVIFYFLWNLQLNTFFNAVTLFLMFYNLGLTALNLTPAFPFDGGRVVRAAAWGISGSPGFATRLAGYLGWAVSAALAGWGTFLMTQKARFNMETSLATFLVCILTVISLLIYKRWKWDRPEMTVHRGLFSMALRSAAVFLLLLPLAAVTICLAPLNRGLEAPGTTASVEPMIQLPQQYRNDSSGSLILLTVIPQAPILSGEWFYAHFDHSIRLVPQEDVVPKDQTAQSVSKENYEAPMDSETKAIIVGMELAGYQAKVNNDGVSITSVLTTSPASTVLQPDDIITSINDIPITTTADLTDYVSTLKQKSILDIIVKRNGQPVGLSVPTMEPETAGGSVRIGISIVQHNSGFNLPFPVQINAQKVNGGPSAGLMFTLGVYDLLTQGDLTGGRKIAGTGTIDLDGSVGPIGGVQQKVVAAERAGAEYFLCPADNYNDAVAMAKHIKVIKVTTAQEAINFLKSLPPKIKI
jgi:PDZ domain-containing protein